MWMPRTLPLPVGHASSVPIKFHDIATVGSMDGNSPNVTVPVTTTSVELFGYGTHEVTMSGVTEGTTSTMPQAMRSPDPTELCTTMARPTKSLVATPSLNKSPDDEMEAPDVELYLTDAHGSPASEEEL